MSADEHLSPQQFTAKYRPAYYSDTWKGVEEHPDFQAGGDEMWDMDSLAESLHSSGMQQPVEISEGEVVEGHHRVVAALHTNTPIRYRSQR